MLCRTHKGAGIHQIDPDEERDPPPSATPVDFPSAEAVECRTWNEETPPPNFQSLFTGVLKPTDICEAHFKALNIELNPGCSIEDMLPAAEPGSSYLPSLAESDKLATDNAPHVDATKARTGPERKRKDFHDRVAELRLDNAMAYRAITRNFKQGVKPPRLAYMRVFWQGLESMSQYWDCTMDQYYSVDEDDPTSEHSPKRQKLDSFSSMSNSDADASEASDALPVRTSNCDASSTTTTQTPAAAFHSTDLGKWATSMDEDLTPPIELAEFVGPTLRSRSGMRYKGLRTNSGRYMPDQFRVEAVRGFVEGAVWPFQCSVYLPRMMPLVHFNKLNLPVRQSVAVYQLPKDRARAKAGGLVGPVLGVQVRPETEFGDDEAKARLDVMREIGGLLQLAQERAREGKKEIKPGEGKWWTTVPRWGGGLGGEVEDQQGNSDIVDIAAELLDATRGEPGKATREASRKRQKKTPAVLWKELKCGSGYFDPKTDYAAIGKNPASEADEVFLVSALNHHISILKLTVHSAYVNYLLSEAMRYPLPQDPQWCRPKLQRSRWFDLFLEDDRVEAFQALWAVTAYLTRETGSEQAVGKARGG